MMMSNIPLRRLTLLPGFVALCALLVVGGCGIFSPDEPIEGFDTPSEYTDLETPEDVITNLQLAYNDENYDRYDDLRHDDFEFQFPADEFDLAESADGRWDLIRDGESTEAMFNGGTSKGGEIVQSIDLSMVPESAINWSSDVEPEFAGSVRRVYEIRMDVVVAPGATTYQVRSRQEFYVVPVSVDGKTEYRLRFWRDFGDDLTKMALAGTP